MPTPQGPELQIDMSTLERPVLLLEVSTPQHRGLSCTWTCLNNSSLCCFWTYVCYRCLCCPRICLHLVCILQQGLSFTYTVSKSEPNEASHRKITLLKRKNSHVDTGTFMIFAYSSTCYLFYASLIPTSHVTVIMKGPPETHHRN